jgi:type VII secretion-associated serine protease mycosin
MLRVASAALLGLVLLAPAAAPAAGDPVRDAQWHLDYLAIAEAHRYSTGEGVLVAVVDGGVDPRHPDLEGSVLPGTDLTLAGRLAGDDPRGWKDRYGHGTGMAGLIAAHGRSLGIAPKATIQPVRTFFDGGQFDGTEIPEGVMWAATHGAKVINVSAGTDHEPALEEAVKTAARNDVVVVAGVGNKPRTTEIGYPAAYRGVLAVGAVDRSGNRADFSLTGPEVMITAPGVDITSPGLNGGYTANSFGTSDATAIVSGAVALVRAKYPQLTASEVIRRITETADDKGPPGKDDDYGYGVLNIVRALTAELASPTPSAGPAQDSGGIPLLPVVIGVLVLLVVAVGTVWIINRTRQR